MTIKKIMAIDINLIKQLREETSASVADVKKVLDEANGDINKARELLKKKGFDAAAKKADRVTEQGIVESYVHGGGKIGVLVELLCETDFVARTDEFKHLAHEIALQISAMNPKEIEALLKQESIRDASHTIEDMVKETIAYLEELRSHGEKIIDVIKSELDKRREKYADPRRTKVYKGKVGECSEEDHIPNEPTVITFTNTGYIKRQSLNTFHTQHRGGKGITGMNVKDEDGIFHIRSAQTHDNILFFTNRGKAYALKAYEISESSRTSKGSAIVNLLNIEAGEKVEIK